jgi:hypothetical protein
VDGIAVAFADGAPIVYLKDNLHLGDSELVIPAGKKLDLSRDVSIDQIGALGKIVVADDNGITFNNGSDPNKYDIKLFQSPGAKIIATKTFIDINVEAIENAEAYSEFQDTTRHIKVLPEQVITIQTFGLADTTQWENYISTQLANNGNYIPILVPNGTVIGKDLAEIISKYGTGRKVYLIGDITITGEINLTGTDAWTPPDPLGESNGQLYNIIPDAEGSLLIGGAVIFQDQGEVRTKSGLTVLGTLTTKGDRYTAKVNAAGPLVAYLLRLESGGGGFGGEVTLIGTLPSRFGGNASFDDTLTVNGSVIIDDVTLKGTASLNGPVEFLGKSNSVTTTGSGFVKLNGPVTLSNESPVDITNEAMFSLNDGVSGLSYTYAYGTTGSVGFTKPVTFNANASFGAQAIFEGGATFNSDAVFSTGTISFGTVGNTYFAKNVTLPTIGGGSISAVTFNKGATIINSVPFFSSTVTSNNSLNLLLGGTFSGVTSINGALNIPAGSQITLYSGAKIDYNNGAVVIAPLKDVNGKAGTGGIEIPVSSDGTQYDTVLLSDGNLNIGSGTVSVGSLSIDISGGGQIVLSGTRARDKWGLVMGSASDYKETIITKGYTITAGDSKGGTTVALFSITEGKIALGNNGITGIYPSAGTQAELGFAGTTSTITLKKDITIDGVVLNLGGQVSNGGSISVDQSIKSPVAITLTGGSFGINNGGSVTATGEHFAGGIILGGSIGVFGGSISNSSGQAVTGYIVAKDNSGFVTAKAGTKDAAGSAVAKLGSDRVANIVVNTAGSYGVNSGLEIFANGVAGLDKAKNIVLTNDSYDSVSAGGSVAVFYDQPVLTE